MCKAVEKKYCLSKAICVPDFQRFTVKINESQMSQWGVVVGRLSLRHRSFSSSLRGSRPCQAPHPPKQIKCLIQRGPLPAPRPQPLSAPQGTMPTVIRRQPRWSHTETQVQQSAATSFRLMMERTCCRGNTDDQM